VLGLELGHELELGEELALAHRIAAGVGHRPVAADAAHGKALVVGLVLLLLLG